MEKIDTMDLDLIGLSIIMGLEGKRNDGIHIQVCQVSWKNWIILVFWNGSETENQSNLFISLADYFKVEILPLIMGEATTAS